jgi:hypothetical protein
LTVLESSALLASVLGDAGTVGTDVADYRQDSSNPGPIDDMPFRRAAGKNMEEKL